jgi:hypothetical protein
MVMPSPGKPFEVFAEEDNIRRQWAQQQVGGALPSEAANQNLTTGAVVLYSLSILQPVIYFHAFKPCPKE